MQLCNHHEQEKVQLMSLPRWEYFLSIESDLEIASRYVEFSQANYSTYSVHFARIITAAGSEFDSVAKDLCELIDSTKKPENINQYEPVISGRYSKFVDMEIEVSRFQLSLSPWKNWTAQQSPSWWSQGFNKIKHDRTNYYNQANLENALNASAGLFVGLLYFYYTTYGQIEISAFEGPRLFSTIHPNSGGSNGGITCDLNVLL